MLHFCVLFLYVVSYADIQERNPLHRALAIFGSRSQY
jgi:hypothetical protein